MAWQKLLIKPDLVIYSYVVTMSRQYLSVDIILSNKMDFKFVRTWIVSLCQLHACIEAHPDDLWLH